MDNENKLNAVMIDADISEVVRARLVRDLGISAQEAQQAEAQFIKFATLFRITGDIKTAPEAADMFWHTFLLYTEDYQAWCAKTFRGGRFLHHFPDRATSDSWATTQKMAEDYFSEKWMEAATSSGGFASSSALGIWPSLEKVNR